MTPDAARQRGLKVDASYPSYARKLDYPDGIAFKPQVGAVDAPQNIRSVCFSETPPFSPPLCTRLSFLNLASDAIYVALLKLNTMPSVK
jgi:hypothetical protein